MFHDSVGAGALLVPESFSISSGDRYDCEEAGGLQYITALDFMEQGAGFPQKYSCFQSKNSCFIVAFSVQQSGGQRWASICTASSSAQRWALPPVRSRPGPTSGNLAFVPAQGQRSRQACRLWQPGVLTWRAYTEGAVERAQPGIPILFRGPLSQRRRGPERGRARGRGQESSGVAFQGALHDTNGEEVPSGALWVQAVI